MLDQAVQERIAMLPIGILASAQILCREHQLDFSETIQSDLFFGYLAGYPVPFDNLSEALGSAVRKVLFDGCYGRHGEEFARRAIRLIESDDADARAGLGFGIPDGDRFMAAITQHVAAEGCTDSMTAMFAIKLALTDQTVPPDESMTVAILSDATTPAGVDDLSARKDALAERIARFKMR